MWTGLLERSWTVSGHAWASIFSLTLRELFSPCLLRLPKYHWLGGLNNRNEFSLSSGGWKSKIKVLAGLISPEASLLSLQVVTFSLCLHMACPLCACIPGTSYSSCKDTSHNGCVPPIWPYLALIISLKFLSLNTVTLRVSASTYEFMGDTIQTLWTLILSLLQRELKSTWEVYRKLKSNISALYHAINWIRE